MARPKSKSKTKTPARPERPAGTPERRRWQRKRVLWTGQVEATDHLVNCAVLDVSLQGARVRLDDESTALPNGPLAIAVSRFGTFQAEVVWTRDGMSGLRFLESVDRVADTIGRQLPLAMVA
jgi:PilZ domain-containing protein